MISIFDFFSDLTNPALAFLPKALLISVMSSIVCAVVGTHVVLRGMAFIGDAVAHAVFPGIAIAFVMQGSLLVGGAIAGGVVASLVAVFSQNRKVKEDTLIGIFFAAAFALGLVIISQINGYTASLTSFLFGSITGVPDSDIILVAVVGTVVVVALLLLNKELVTTALDRETARAQNLPVFWLDLVLYFAVTAAVVISVRTIGNILVLALLVTPAATARAPGHHDGTIGTYRRKLLLPGTVPILVHKFAYWRHHCADHNRFVFPRMAICAAAGSDHSESAPTRHTRPGACSRRIRIG